MTDNRLRGEPPPEAPRSAKTGRDRKETSGQEGDGQPTFEETRKEFLNFLWKRVPRRLRLPLVALIVIGAALLSTQSFWYRAVILVNQREPGFSKDLTGVLVTRIVGDDAHDSLQGDLVDKLNAELQKEETGQQIELHASSEIVNENYGLKVAHERARAIGQRLNAKIVIWGRKIGEKKFDPRITVMAAPKNWSAARERTHDVQIIDEVHLPEELVDEPFYLIHFAAGYSYYIQRKYEKALPHFKAALGRQGALPKELADLQLFTGVCLLGDQKSIAAHLEEAIGLYEKAARVYQKVDQKKWAATQYCLGAAYESLPTGDRGANRQKAIAHYDEVIGLDPKDAGTYTYRGLAYYGKGDYDKAVADYDQAIRLDAKDAVTYTCRGLAYYGKGDYDKAVADYDQAIRLDPKDAFAYNELAWLLGTCPQASFRNGKKAVEYATKACELSEWKNPNTMDTLAAAYAEAGDFKQAIKWETKYLETSNLSEKEARKAKNRLVLYQARQPYAEK